MPSQFTINDIARIAYAPYLTKEELDRVLDPGTNDSGIHPEWQCANEDEGIEDPSDLRNRDTSGDDEAMEMYYEQKFNL